MSRDMMVTTTTTIILIITRIIFPILRMVISSILRIVGGTPVAIDNTLSLIQRWQMIIVRTMRMTVKMTM